MENARSVPRGTPASATRASRRPSRRLRTRITPDDRKLEVRIFLAALASGASVRAAAKVATLSERRILRWVAFNGFLPAVQEAQRKGQIAKDDPLGQAPTTPARNLLLRFRTEICNDRQTATLAAIASCCTRCG